MLPDGTMTPEDIQRQYNAAMDSVNLINQVLAGTHDSHMSAAMKTDALVRNAAHLEIVLQKDWWTNEDLQPFRDAIAAARA